VNREGRKIPVEESSTTIRDDMGATFIGVVIAIRDIVPNPVEQLTT